MGETDGSGGSRQDAGQGGEEEAGSCEEGMPVGFRWEEGARGSLGGWDDSLSCEHTESPRGQDRAGAPGQLAVPEAWRRGG